MRKKSLLMDTLTPLGIIFYNARLWWSEFKREGCQRKDATDPDLPALVRNSARLRNILARRM